MKRFDFGVFGTRVSFMTTRPKAAYDRQGLAGGQDTDKMGTYWGVLYVSLRASQAQLGYIPTYLEP